MWYSKLEKVFISRHTLHKHWYICPIALPVRWNPRLGSLLTVVSAAEQGDLVVHHLRLSKVLERISRPTCEPLYATNTSHREEETFIYDCPLHWVLLLTKKRHNRTLLFGNTILKHGRQFDYWYHPLDIRMRVCYLDCHEAELCCYLVIHIENIHHYSCFTSICDLFIDYPSYDSWVINRK
jgi:hypothetical protein